MPGPAPPSKSYLLKIIDSSDEEDNSYDNSKNDVDVDMDAQDPDTSARTEDLASPSPDTSLRSNHSDVAYIAEASETGSCANIATHPPTKRKRKKKKKKKNRSVSTISAEDDGASATSNKAVKFDSVSVRSFERVLGTDGVPYDGGWPLGLGQVVGDVEVLDLEAYEKAKQERLRIRAEEKGLPMDNAINDDKATVLETRQWDYKHKAKNPLFHLLQEEQRMNILLESSPSETELDSASAQCSAASSPPKQRNGRGSPDKKRRDSSNKDSNGSRNGTIAHPHSGHHTHHGLHHTGHHINTRSKSKRERSGSFSSQERYNDRFTQVAVHHVRNELEELRFQRTGEGHTGCTCRKLDVYLLPPNAGKKAHHRRMNVKRVKDELRKRHMLPDDQKTREELELMLHNAVENEACCISQDCPCVRNGIGCQADVCTCWHSSHQTKECGSGKKHATSYDTPVAEIQALCGNANGMYAVDMQKIQAFRAQVLDGGPH